MSAPSASNQAARARDRAAEEFKVRLESLESRYKVEMKALTDRVHSTEGELKELRASNTRLQDSSEGFHRRIVELEDFKDISGQSHRIFEAKLAVEKSRLDVAAADMEVLAPGLNVDADEGGGEEVDAEQDREPPQPSGSNVQAQAAKAAGLSEAARDSDEVKVSMVLGHVSEQ
jgi:hypothetical protein